MQAGTTILLIAIYLRVSTKDQAQKGHSIPEQREAARAKAEVLARELERSSGATVELQLHEFLDDFGGDIAERPVLEAVREFVKTHKPRYFICLDPDRFSRDLELQLIVTSDIEKAGTQLVFVQHNYEKTAEGIMFYQIRGVISQFEKAKILERTSRGKKGKMKSGGRPNGACPFGYRHNPEADQLEVYEAEARWVRAIFEWVAEERLTPSGVAQRLNDLGVPTKRSVGKWYRAVVGNILSNTAYIGQMRCNRADARGLMAIRRLPRERRRPLSPVIRPQEEWILVPVPLIVERELYEAAHRSLSQTSRRGKRTPPGLLSLLVKCGVCGRGMSYSRNKGGRHGGRAYFHCRARYTNDYRLGTTSCSNRFHQVAPVELGVWNQLVEWLTNPDLVAEYLAVEAGTTDNLANQTRRLQERRSALFEQLVAKQREQVIIIQKQAQGLIAGNLADSLLGAIQQQVQQIEVAIGDVETELSRMQLRLETVHQTVKGFEAAAAALAAERNDILTRLADLTFDQKRELVLRLVRSVTVYADGTWRIDPC